MYFALIAYQDPRDSSRTLFATALSKVQELEDLNLGDVVAFVPFPTPKGISALRVKKTNKTTDIHRILTLMDNELAYNWPSSIHVISLGNLVNTIVRSREQFKTATDIHNYFQRSGLTYIGRQEDKFFFWNSLSAPSPWPDCSCGSDSVELV